MHFAAHSALRPDPEYPHMHMIMPPLHFAEPDPDMCMHTMNGRTEAVDPLPRPRVLGACTTH